MSLIALKYNLAKDALIPWLAFTEMGNEATSSVSASIKNTGMLFVWNEIVESDTLTKEYRFKPNGKLYVPNIVEGYPDIPITYSGTTIDVLTHYAAGAPLDNLNSGSNEWNNITDYAAYDARHSYWDIFSSDTITEYVSGSSLSASLTGLGEGIWDDNHWDWYGRNSYFASVVQDSFDEYATGSELNGLNKGVSSPPYISWSLAWVAKTQTMYGVKGFENFSEYATGSNLNGQNGVSDIRWTSFSGSWRVV